MVSKKATTKTKLVSVGNGKSNSGIAVPKRKYKTKTKRVKKSIVTLANATFLRDLEECTQHYNIQAPTDIIRMLVKKEADAIRALKTGTGAGVSKALVEAATSV